MEYKLGIDVVISGVVGEPKFENCKLVPRAIPLGVGKCLECGEEIRCIPDFMTKGTSLTLLAQALVAVVYHQPKMGGWRVVCEILCSKEHGIAHTTLFRGYHSFGDNIITADALLDKIIKETVDEEEERAEKLPEALGEGNSEGSPKENLGVKRKAVKSENKKREKAIITYFSLVWLLEQMGFREIWTRIIRLMEDLKGRDSFKFSCRKAYVKFGEMNTS